MYHLRSLFFCCAALFQTIAQDSTAFITVHVIYGSKPKAPGEHKWFGGKMGGHVGLEVSSDKVIHFNPSGQVRVFGTHSKPGNFHSSTVEHFYCTFGCDTVRKLSVTIPVSIGDRARLDSISDHFLYNSPYPYAFFGMRCTSSCYHLLSVAQIFPTRSKYRMIIRYFYPRRLRRKLLHEAKKNKWEVLYSEGTERRKWDHD